MKHIYLFITIAMRFSADTVKAQWNGNPAIAGNPVSRALFSETKPRCISDGAGGMLCIWSGNGGFYAQRKTSSGAIVWSAIDKPIQILSGINGNIFDMIPDGGGGAYVSIQQNTTDTTTNIYVQHLKNDGTLPYGPFGIRVNPLNNHYNTDPKICCDATGIIVTWGEEIRNNATFPPTYLYAQVYAQRYDPSGVPQWGSNGMQVSTAPGYKNTPEIISDDNGGAFIAFTDYRNADLRYVYAYYNLDIYAQHISKTGSRLWGTTDLVISNDSSNQNVYVNYYPHPAKSMISDSAGGFIIVYANDFSNPALFAQRVNATGQLLFGKGVLLSSAKLNERPYLNIVSDGEGGVVACWGEWVNSQNNYVRAQRVSSTGGLVWGASPVIVCPVADENFNHDEIGMARDNLRNVFITWHSGPFGTNMVRAQKLNNAGVPQWASAIDICTNQDANPSFVSLAPGDNNSMIAVWQDSRNQATSGSDIYAIKILSNGNLADNPAQAFFTTTNGNWNDPSVWTSGQVPDANADVVVRNQITVTVDAACNSLSVQQPGKITIAPGVSFDIKH